MGEWMSGIIHIDDLKEQVGDNIELLQKLKDTDSSIAKINLGLGKLFINIGENDIIFKDGSTETLDDLFEELNKTGFMRARKLGLIYKPYKVHFKKNKKKANVMKAELATKTAIPSISRELRTEKGETAAPHGTTLRGGSEETVGKISDERIVAYRSDVIGKAHGQWAVANRLAKKLFGESLPEPKYAFTERAENKNAGYVISALYVTPINTVEFNDTVLLPIYEHQKNASYKNVGGKVIATAGGYEATIGHELTHAVVERLLGPKPFVERTQLSEALADLVGIYLAVEKYGLKSTDTVGTLLLIKVASDLERNSAAIKEYSESAKRAIEKGTDYDGASVALERLLDATNSGNFRLDLLYRNPQIAISTAILQVGVKTEDDLVKFIRDITSNPFAFKPLKNVLGEDALNKQISETLNAIRTDSARRIASFETELNEAIKARDLEKPKTIIQKFVAAFVPKPTKPLDFEQIDKKAEFNAMIQRAEAMASKFDDMVEKVDVTLKAHGYS